MRRRMYSSLKSEGGIGPGGPVCVEAGEREGERERERERESVLLYPLVYKRYLCPPKLLFYFPATVLC